MALQRYADKKLQELAEQRTAQARRASGRPSRADAEEEVSAPSLFSEEDLNHLVEWWAHRWEQFHSPLHSLAYALDPEFFCCADLLVDPDISADIDTALKAIYHDDTPQRHKVDAELMKLRLAYANNDDFTEVAKQVPGYTLWGGKHINTVLRPLAMRLLGQVVSSSGCERMWSAYGHIHCDSR